jgi:hypothetical protein
MNKHEEARKMIGKLRNRFSVSIGDFYKEDYDGIDNYINRAEQTEKELELYKAFVNEFQFYIANSIEHSIGGFVVLAYESLYHRNATDKAIELFKQIQALGGKQE